MLEDLTRAPCAAVWGLLISGRGGIEPPPNHFPGASVNAALDLLVQGLGRRYGPQGVRSNAVDPGPIESPRLNSLSSVTEELTRSRRTALPGPGRPRDVAGASDRGAPWHDGAQGLLDPVYPAAGGPYRTTRSFAGAWRAGGH
nr:SDR family oxidoreductase [Pseudomonas sp. GX19020]